MSRKQRLLDLFRALPSNRQDALLDLGEVLARRLPFAFASDGDELAALLSPPDASLLLAEDRAFFRLAVDMILSAGECPQGHAAPHSAETDLVEPPRSDSFDAVQGVGTPERGTLQ